VDEFLGKNDGLVVAELEMESEDYKFENPDWLGEEVTYNREYYNSDLTLNPFSQW
jgi:adenylate cyclase